MLFRKKHVPSNTWLGIDVRVLCKSTVYTELYHNRKGSFKHSKRDSEGEVIILVGKNGHQTYC